MIKPIIVSSFLNLIIITTCFAGLSRNVKTVGLVQSWDENTVTLSSGKRQIKVPKKMIQKQDLVEGKRVTFSQPIPQTLSH